MIPRSLLPALPLLACLALPGAAAPTDGLLELPLSPRLADAERALARAEKEIADDPASYEAQLRISFALNQVLAIRTNGNLPLVDGLQDSAANRLLWSELGTRALGYARQAHAQRPDSIQAASALATSYMFYAASQGIVSAILQGTAGEYRTHAQRLIDMDPAYDDGLGHTLLASLNLVAPWPVRDWAEALRHYERAAELAPDSVRNQYGLGVYWARDGDRARARRHLQRVVSQPCTAHTEQLFCDWMKAEAQRVLSKLGAG